VRTRLRGAGCERKGLLDFAPTEPGDHALHEPRRVLHLRDVPHALKDLDGPIASLLPKPDGARAGNEAIGADGDTNEYLERVPEYLADLNFFGVSFVGIVAPYPETPFFRQLAQEGRLLPGAKMRDLDGYTVCHRPTRLSPDEVVEHYKRLCVQLSSLRYLGRHLAHRFFMSDVPYYSRSLVMTTKEISTIKRPLDNHERSYIAGRDPIEAWDAQHLLRLGIPPQPLVAPPPARR
jgi:hypothetical protein